LCYAEKSENYAVQISNVEILPDPVAKIKAYTGHTSFPNCILFMNQKVGCIDMRG
jgi:hypothetical protein